MLNNRHDRRGYWHPGWNIYVPRNRRRPRNPFTFGLKLAAIGLFSLAVEFFLVFQIWKLL